MKIKIILFVFSSVLLSCDSNTEESSVEKDAESKIGLYDVSGVNLYDEIGVAQGVFGTPNDFSIGGYVEVVVEEDEGQGVEEDGGVLVTSSLLEDKAFVRPNPFKDVFSIQTTYQIDNVWVFKGVVVDARESNQFKKSDFSEEYSVENIKKISSLMHLSPTSSLISIDFTDFENGVYKVFVESQGKLFWVSVYNSEGSLSSYISLNYWE